jgi:hypothetical protein
MLLHAQKKSSSRMLPLAGRKKGSERVYFFLAASERMI